MTTKRFFFLFFALIALGLALTSCELLPFDLFPGSDTGAATSQTTSEVTTMTTTTMTTTTTAAAALPSRPSEGGITRATELSSGAIRLTYGSGVTQSLGALKLREGYNSAAATMVSLSDGVLTLTLLDSAGANTAGIFLETAPSAVTLRLRERDGYLEWADATEENWQVLCAAKLGLKDTLPLVLLAEATGVGRAEPPTGEGVVLATGGGKLRFRSREWKDGIDLCYDAVLRNPNSNNFFNFKSMTEVASSTPLSELTGGTHWKDAGDDITGQNFNGTSIGANHGYSIIAKIPNVGKTEDDVGSVWVSDSGQKFCLVKVEPSLLWMCPFDDAAMKNGNFTKYSKKAQLIKAGERLTHVDGALNTNTITAASDSIGDPNQMQFWISVNQVKMRAFLNGTTEVDLEATGTYEAEFVDMHVTYKILYLPAVLEYLMDNAGKNDNESHHSEKITDWYMEIEDTYRFHKNGSLVVYSDYTVVNELYNATIRGVQSMAMSSNSQYVYVPGSTNYGVPTIQEKGTQANVYARDLEDVTKLPTTFFHMTDAIGTKTMNLGYNPEFGCARNEVRREYYGSKLESGSAHLLYTYTTFKLYPRLLMVNTATPGERFEFISYRIPSVATDEDFTVINWYWVGDTIYLQLHTTKTVGERAVALPDYMTGMNATVTEGSDSFTVHSSAITADGITVSSTGAGYAIVKLTPAE